MIWVSAIVNRVPVYVVALDKVLILARAKRKRNTGG